LTLAVGPSAGWPGRRWTNDAGDAAAESPQAPEPAAASSL
jgi:hypothetical protein